VAAAAPAGQTGAAVCPAPEPLRSGWSSLEGGAIGPPPPQSADRLKLHHILGLRALCPRHNLEFDFLTLLQGAKALARDVTVVDEDIGAIVPGNKAVALGIAEPSDRAFYPPGTSTSKDSGPGSA
jgi:hypothetical protein